MFAKFFRLFAVAVVSLFVVASLAACDPEDGGSSNSSPFVPVDCSSGQCVAVSTPVPAPTVAPQPTPDQQEAEGSHNSLLADIRLCARQAQLRLRRVTRVPNMSTQGAAQSFVQELGPVPLTFQPGP